MWGVEFGLDGVAEVWLCDVVAVFNKICQD